MSKYIELIRGLEEVTGSSNVMIEEPMKNHTSFKVGGAADILVLPESATQVQAIIKLCRENNVKYYLIGNGSNLIVKDGGIRGVVIKLTKLDKIHVEDNKVIAEGGASLQSVAQVALGASLKGMEFASGIPGSIGGAAAMNAGAYDGEMSMILESVLVIDNNGELLTLTKDEMELDYRNSAILKHGYAVLEVTLGFQVGEHQVIKARMDTLAKKRSDIQPLEYPSAGSTFKRPEGYFSGKLIQDCELKGVSIGGAQVSEKHSGFIINKENATAKDILDLIAMVQSVVKERFGVELHTEVRIWGEDR